MQVPRLEIKPWTVDAKDIDVSGDIEGLRKSLFHTNSQIERFLADGSRGEILVVGPKGFGKTLLLKVKRRQLENSGYTLLPKDALLDKPIGTPNIYHLREFDSLLSDPQYWRSVWLISISLLIIKIHRAKILRLYCERLRPILDDSRFISVCDIFDRIISLPREDYHHACDDLRATLIPEFRQIHTPVALFIDNIDEYFETAILFRSNSAKSRNARKEFWYLAQYGLANAARELNGINNHIKVCASVRQEIFQRAGRNDAMAIQLHGSAIELKYDKEDLLEIIKKNINSEKSSNFVSPKDNNHLRKFFGNDSLTIEHQYTNEDENVEDFILRHTLWRPRDVAVIGQKLSEINPIRRTTGKIRDVVNSQATLIAETYLEECRPHISNLVEEKLFPLIRGNVISREQLVNISQNYDLSVNEDRGTPNCKNHVFYDLFCLGLLGYVREYRKGGAPYQHFQSVGETRLNSSGIVPDAEIYLIHPILCEVIAKHNSDFLNNIDGLNIIGRGRPWRNVSDIFFVLKGDVVGYSKIMATADLSDKFPKDFKQFIQESAKNLFFAEASGGDGVLLIDRNWKSVIASALSLKSKMQESVYSAQFRFGGDAGIIRFDLEDRKNPDNLRGGALRTAARLEEQGLAGSIVVTDRFKKYTKEDQSKYVLRELTHEELPKARIHGDMFNLAKNDTEEGIYHKVYIVE